MVRSGTLTVVGSATKRIVLSPPPVTVAALETVADTLPSPLTVRVISGYATLEASTSGRVQVRNVVPEQIQPVTVKAVAGMTEGRPSFTTTLVPTVAIG